MVALQVRKHLPPNPCADFEAQISFTSSVQVYGSCWAQGMSILQTMEIPGTFSGLRQWRQDPPPH